MIRGWLRRIDQNLSNTIEEALVPHEPAMHVVTEPQGVSSQRLIRDALAEIDSQLVDPATDRETRDALLLVRFKLRPSAPVVPGGPS